MVAPVGYSDRSGLDGPDSGPHERLAQVSPQSRPTLRVCSVTDAVNAVGDRYSLPVVRELLYGNHRFSELAARAGARRTLLAGRLRKLEELGVVQRRRYSTRPPRDEYLLTRS